MKPQWEKHIPVIVKFICNGGIKTEPQFAAATEYLLNNAVNDTVDEEQFKEASGVGIVYTPDLIEDTIADVLVKYKEDLITQRYSFNVGKPLGEYNNVCSSLFR